MEKESNNFKRITQIKACEPYIKDFYNSNIKTSRLFDLTAGNLGSPLFRGYRSFGKPHKISPIPFEKYGFANSTVQNTLYHDVRELVSKPNKKDNFNDFE